MAKPPMRAATPLPTVDSGALDRAGNAAGARQVRREEAGAAMGEGRVPR